MPIMNQHTGSPLEWRDEFNTGIGDIDAQHKTLLHNLNKLSRLAERDGARMPQRAVWQLLEQLNEYAAYHFLSEESLLNEHLPGTVETARHLAAHRSYWSMIAHFRERFERGESGIAHELLSYLSRWWIKHILDTDRNMGRMLNDLGIG